MVKMLHRTITNILLNQIYKSNLTSVRRSALFINGAKATEQFVYVIPFVDFNEYSKQKDLIQKQILKRRQDYDFNKLDELWHVFDELKKQKIDYERRKDEVSKELGKLMKDDPEGEIVKKLKIQLGLLKENIKKLKIPLWSAEEAAMVEYLRLPNYLHPQTPDKNEILYVHLSPPISKKDHMTIIKELDIVELKNKECYYLKGDAAMFELGAIFYISDVLRKNGYCQFSNPDFVKSVIVEGCGLDHRDPESTFILHHNEESKVNIDSRLHLTGGGSLCSFFAYYAKNILYPKALPLKYFSMGRQYVPSPSNEHNLFNVCQSSVIQLFGVARNADELNVVLNELIGVIKTMYSKLNYHFRITVVSAEKLSTWESLRVSIEMFSTSLGNYVEIGNISLSGDFISKRLMLTYVDKKISHFPHVISGTILNVPKFLACVLEQDEDFYLPKQFRVENWAL